jgi:hypothetical protein
MVVTNEVPTLDITAPLERIDEALMNTLVTLSMRKLNPEINV